MDHCEWITANPAHSPASADWTAHGVSCDLVAVNDGLPGAASTP